jgi:hypothetical protein
VDADTEGTQENGWSDPLWGRQTGESDKAFAAFGCYRDFGPSRSLAQVGEASGKSRALLERWSSTWGWVARASRWDDQADENQRERDLIERQEVRAKMLAAHAKGGAALHAIGSSVLDRFDTSDPETAATARARIERLSLIEAARLMEAGARMERVARENASGRVTDAQALKFVEKLLDIALAYMPLESQEAFLTDVDAILGTGHGL